MPHLPKRCPVCKGGVIQRLSGHHQGGVWFQCSFCDHIWRFRVEDARSGFDGELVGEVFVAGADGTRRSLGSVALNAIPEYALTEHLERKTAQRERESGRLQREIDALAAKLEEARVEEGRLWDIQKLDESNVEKARAWSLVYNKTKSLVGQIEDLRARRRHLTSGAYFFQDMPPAISSAETDADGRFTLLMPRDGRYGIVVLGSREIAEGKDTHCWFVWVDLGGEHSKRLVLSDANLVGAGSVESALR